MSRVVLLWVVLSFVSGVRLRKERFESALETNEDQQHTVSTGVIRGRLQIFSPEADRLSCLTRETTNSQNFLFVSKCTYDSNRFFELDLDKGELRSVENTNSFWVYDSDASEAVVKGIGGRAKGRSFFTMQKSGNKWRWDISVADFEPMVISNDHRTTLCVEVSEIGEQQYAYMRVVNNGATDQCAQVKFMLPQDDYVSGNIHHFGTASSDNAPPECVTYDKTAVPPRSALYLEGCDPARTDQRFMYNMVTRHLRWATETAGNIDGPVLFYWWSGPIKSYPDFEEQQHNYGWSISLLNEASVIALDDRGYTGYCWSLIQDGTGRRSVSANQTCSSFALMPERENFFVKRLQTPPRKTTTVVFRLRQGKCLRTHRESRLVGTGDGTSNVDRVWRLIISDCNFESYWLPQRFVITQKVGSSCSTSTCQGMIRWVGDYEHALFVASLPETGPLVGNFPMASSGLDEAHIPYEFDFPFDREAPIRTTLPGGKPACLGQIPTVSHVVLTTDMSFCLTFRATLATQTGPDNDDPAILTLARFDFTSHVVMAKTNEGMQMQESAIHELRQQARSDGKALHKFRKYFDFYFADLGVTGRRRFSRSGSGLEVTPLGDISANAHPNHHNGVQFRFSHTAELQRRFTLVAITLQVTTLDPEKTYLIMSFARASGCLVFLTGRGRLGMKCRHDGKDMFTLQVQDWADPSFSLTQSYHKVSLLFSTLADDPVRLYVDGVLVLSMSNAISWNILRSSQHIHVFTDSFFFWQYRPLPASLTRFSLVVSNELSKLDALARRNVLVKKLEFGKFMGDPNAIVTASGFQTSWSDCKAINNATNGFVEGFTCTLSVFKNGQPVTVPRDVLNLACSRPRCTIGFDPASPVVGSSFKFSYFSNYPSDLVSENVGSPAPFRDPSFVSDGWTTRSVSFGIEYAPEPGSLLEVDESQQVSDVMRYRCKQNCCVSIGNANMENAQGDTF